MKSTSSICTLTDVQCHPNPSLTEMTLSEVLIELCKETPHMKSKFSFELLYRMVYDMCKQGRYSDVRSSLYQTIQHIKTSPNTSWHYERIKDVSIYYNNTCSQKELPTFITMYQEYQPQSQFTTPPSTP